MLEKNQALPGPGNSLPLAKLQTMLEMVYSAPYCCKFLDDWYKDITGTDLCPEHTIESL